MTNNDIFRRIRYLFDFSDAKMIALFKLAEFEVNRSDVSDWLKREGDPDFQMIQDKELAIFLNGLIIDKRGRKDGPLPEPETRLNNNVILRKLRIALNLKSEEMLELFASVEINLSKHELSAFFRKHDNKSYRPCMDQYLRGFLNALQTKYREQPD